MKEFLLNISGFLIVSLVCIIMLAIGLSVWYTLFGILFNHNNPVFEFCKAVTLIWGVFCSLGLIALIWAIIKANP